MKIVYKVVSCMKIVYKVVTMFMPRLRFNLFSMAAAELYNLERESSVLFLFLDSASYLVVTKGVEDQVWLSKVATTS